MQERLEPFGSCFSHSGVIRDAFSTKGFCPCLTPKDVYAGNIDHEAFTDLLALIEDGQVVVNQSRIEDITACMNQVRFPNEQN